MIFGTFSIELYIAKCYNIEGGKSSTPKTEKKKRYTEMTKKVFTILRRHEDIKQAKLQTLTQTYKNPSITKKQVVEELHEEIHRRYHNLDICKYGVFSHNTSTFTYAFMIVSETEEYTFYTTTLYITPKKAVEVEERKTFYLITEFENYNNRFYYRKCKLISKPY